VSSQRRTIAGWLNAVAGAGLILEEVAEPCADEDVARHSPKIGDTRIVPYFLIVRARGELIAGCRPRSTVR